MTGRAQAVYKKVQASSYEDVQFYRNVSEMLAAYPELVFYPNNKLWHDLVKKASPLGGKNDLKYNEADLKPMLEKELKYLLKMSHWVKKILQFEKAHRNKALFLNVLELCENVELNTGGGISPCVARVVLIYEKEGGVTAKKRKSDENEDDVPKSEPAVIEVKVQEVAEKKCKLIDEFPIDIVKAEPRYNKDIVTLFYDWNSQKSETDFQTFPTLPTLDEDFEEMFTSEEFAESHPSLTI